MPLPALTKTYCTYANIPYADTSSAGNVVFSYFFNIKLALMNQLTTGVMSGVRTPQSVWTCYGSSNGTSAGMDGVDRWGTTFNISNFVRASSTNPHSWFVLRNAALDIYLTIDFYSPLTLTTVRFIVSRVAPVPNATPTLSPTTTRGQFTGTAAVSGANQLDNSSLWYAPTGSYALPNGIANAAQITHRSHISISQDGDFYNVTSRAGDNCFYAGHFVSTLTNCPDPYNYIVLGGNGPAVNSVYYDYGTGFPDINSLLSNVGTPDTTGNGGNCGALNFRLGFTEHGPAYLPTYSDLYSKQIYLQSFHIFGINPFAYRGYVKDFYLTVGGFSGVLLPSISSPSYLMLNGCAIPWTGPAPEL